MQHRYNLPTNLTATDIVNEVHKIAHILAELNLIDEAQKIFVLLGFAVAKAGAELDWGRLQTCLPVIASTGREELTKEYCLESIDNLMLELARLQLSAAQPAFQMLRDHIQPPENFFMRAVRWLFIPTPTVQQDVEQSPVAVRISVIRLGVFARPVNDDAPRSPVVERAFDFREQQDQDEPIIDLNQEQSASPSMGRR